MPETLLTILRKTEEFFVRKGVDNARHDARRLIAFGLGLTPLEVFLQHDRPVLPAELARLRDLVARRAQGAPLQHLLGTVQFRHLEIQVDGRALVPRPETELLVELALEKARGLEKPRIHEAGVGTGCVALSLRREMPQALVTGSDISPAALSLAAQNAKTLGIWLPLFRGDLCAALRAEPVLDLLVSNPPYVRRADIPGLAREVQADPVLALDGGPDGLDLVRRLVAEAALRLKPGGWLLIEHGDDQGPATRALCGPDAWSEAATRQDLSGRDRFLVARRS